MKRILRFFAALAGLIVCFLMLVGSDANVTPLRNIILLVIYCTTGCALFQLISKGKHS